MGASEIRALGDQGSGAGGKPGEELDSNGCGCSFVYVG